MHRVWDTGYSDDSDDSTSVIESLVLSGDATYVKEGDEFEGMSFVDEVVTVERVRVVETAFNFDVSCIYLFVCLFVFEMVFLKFKFEHKMQNHNYLIFNKPYRYKPKVHSCD